MISFLIWPIEKKTYFGAIRSWSYFSTAQTERKLRKKLGKTRFVV
jgi:hypothetical protein